MTEEVKETRIIERNWLPLAIVVAALILAFALWSWGTGTANSASNSASYTQEELASAIAIAIANAESDCTCTDTTVYKKDDGVLQTLPVAECTKQGGYGLADGYTSVGNRYSAGDKIVGPAIYKPDHFSLTEETKDHGIYIPIGHSTTLDEGSVVWRFWGENDDIIITAEKPYWNKLFRYQE